MQASNTSIVIVDDTKFSSAIVSKLLTLGGFSDIRVADNAIDALSMIKSRNADILLADWLMPGMDGLQLTQLVRELNRRQNLFTYIVLLTAKEGNEDLKEAFNSGVDDFIGKTNLKSHLLPRVNAAERISKFQNSLLHREYALKEQYRSLTIINRIDHVLGIGNLQFLEQQLSRYLKQHKGRSGNIGLLLFRIDNIPKIKSVNGEAFKNDLLKQASERLRDVARPMDDIARVNENTFALAMYGHSLSFSTHKLLRRVQDSVLQRAYTTTGGFVSLNGVMQFDVIDATTRSPKSATEFISEALTRLSELKEGQSVHLWDNDSAELA